MPLKSRVSWSSFQVRRMLLKKESHWEFSISFLGFEVAKDVIEKYEKSH